MNTIVSSDPLQELDPGSFMELGPDHVVRADEVLLRGRKYWGFFLSRKFEPGVRDYRPGQSAELVKGEPTGQESELNITHSNGMWIREKEVGGVKSLYRQASFDSIESFVPLDHFMEETGPRGSNERGLMDWELLANGPEPSVNIRELLRRAVNVLALPMPGLLALPLLFMGQGRSATASGLGVGLVLMLLFEKKVSLSPPVCLQVKRNGRRVWVSIGVFAMGFLLYIAQGVLLAIGEHGETPPLLADWGVFAVSLTAGITPSLSGSNNDKQN